MRGRTPILTAITNLQNKCIDFLNSITHKRQFNQILAFFFTNGLTHSSHVTTKLVDFCNSIHQMDLACSIFHQIPHPTSFVWTSMIRGFAENGPQHQSFRFFADMHRKGANVNYLTYPFVLKACSGVKAMLEGEQVHAHMFKFGFRSDTYAINGLLDLYSKCGRVDEGRKLYDEMPERAMVSHTLVISGYLGVGDLDSALSIFERVEGADVVLWSAMIGGYAQNGAPDEALGLFYRMQRVGVRPNSFTMVSVLSACSQLGDFETGQRVHELMVRSGIEMNIIVYTSLLDMYIKGGFVDKALKLFDEIEGKDVVSWNSLINGYSKNGYAKEALEAFRRMQDFGLEPNRVTLLGVLSACAQLGALEKGREINHLVEKLGFSSDLLIGTALIDMYAKSASLSSAYRVFRRFESRDIVTWSAMINGCATNGHLKEAMSFFGGMLKSGFRPNEVTFLGLLVACLHGGWIIEGYEFFNSMTRDHDVRPRMEHYACMADLLGRAGKLDEAKSFIGSMPIEPEVSVWGALLAACTIHQNTQIGEFAARQLACLDPASDENYVLMSNIYAAKSRWEDVQNTRTSLKHLGAHKRPAFSWIEVGGKIHEFLVGDGEHPHFHCLNSVSNELSEQTRLVGE
ncbi:hypothetical protein Sjap_017092 [Stephania japonica]|uniref:Pentatricopeptide repeat-containing protein n=1 Tax=Stephania japonica TaxID=461633 RepID=A0AAP0I5I6_9MAGN